MSRLKNDQKERYIVFFIMLFKTQYPSSGVRRVSPWAKSSLQPVFVDKILLGHSHAHLFTDYLWQLSGYNGKVNCSTETVVLQSLIYLFLGLHRKSLLTPGQFKSYSGFMRHKYIHSWNKYMFIFIIMFKEVQGARCIKEQNKSSALMKIIA